MKNTTCIIIILVLFLSLSACKDSFNHSKTEEIRAINKVLTDQTTAWNNGDKQKYMNGYLKSDALVFHNKNGAKYGWNTILEMYEKSFPNRDDMGKLTFEVDTIYSLSNNIKNVAGQWVVHKKDTKTGHFVLTLKKFEDNQWKIIEDHTW